MKKHLLCVGFVAGLMILGMLSQVQAGLIAHWRFEPGAAFTQDSSGNGNHLTNHRASQSTDTPPGGGIGSAYFDGSSGSNAFMRTTSNLNLAPYKYIAIDWWQKVDTTSTAIVWEHSADYKNYDGGLVEVLNESNYLPAYVSMRRTVTPGGYTMDTFPYNSNTWERFTAVVNLGLPAGNTHEVLKVYRNGVLVSTDRLTNGIPAALRSDILYFGARANGQAPFKGWIDEMQIATLPEYVNVVANHPNLVGYWRLGEGNGTTAWEVRGLTGNGTYMNVGAGDYAKPGAIRYDPDTAVAFNGASSYVNAGNDDDLKGNWPGLTIAAWVKPESLTGISVIAGKWAQNPYHDHYGLFLIDGKPGIAVANGTAGESGMTANSSLVLNEWQFVVGTWDASTNQYRIYINGLLDTSGPRGITGFNQNSLAPLGIGAQITHTGGVSRYFKGWIDEVAIFNRALAPQEIMYLYQLANVPEPSTWALAGMSLLSLAGLALRRKRRK